MATATLGAGFGLAQRLAAWQDERDERGDEILGIWRDRCNHLLPKAGATKTSEWIIAAETDHHLRELRDLIAGEEVCQRIYHESGGLTLQAITALRATVEDVSKEGKFLQCAYLTETAATWEAQLRDKVREEVETLKAGIEAAIAADT